MEDKTEDKFQTVVELQNDISETETQEFLPTKHGLPIWIIILSVVALGAAVFLSFRLINNHTGGNGQENTNLVFSADGQTGAVSSSVILSMDRASELPQEHSDKNGVFVRREDNSVFIGTGKISIAAKVDQNNLIDLDTDYDGPVVEVVTNHDTKIYKDETDMQASGTDSSTTERHLQQIVSEGSLDDLKENNIVSVWGTQQGDRIIARILLYR